MEQIGIGKNNWEIEKIGQNKEMENGPLEGDGKGGNNDEREGNGKMEEQNGNSDNLPPINLDPEFLKTLEKLAEKSSQFGRPTGESCPSNSNLIAGNSFDGNSFDGVNKNVGQINKTAESPMEREEEMRSPDEVQDVAEWRQRFEKVLSLRYAKSERIRFLFCRKMYGHYVERVRQINR